MAVDVSRETMLSAYLRLLLKWSAKINLVGMIDEQDAWKRHIEDSLQLVPLVAPQERTILDLGSGGGLPAVPMAICLPDHNITAVESDHRKSVFLQTTRRELGLSNLTVLSQRSEDLAPQDADLVTARGFAPLPRLLEHAHRHLGPKGRALLLKGKAVREEVSDARQRWHFNFDLHPSATAPNGAILEIRELRHA